MAKKKRGSRSLLGPLLGQRPSPPVAQRREPRGVEPTRRFAKDLVREKKGKSAKAGKDLDSLLEETIKLLAADKPLPERFFDHPMQGEWNDHRDCHVKPDLVLIYRKVGEDTLQLVRLGSHSELGI